MTGSPPFRIEPAGARDAPGLDPELASALATDPDGCFVARGADGAPIGRAIAVLRGDVLHLLELSVDVEQRGRGIGAALHEAVRAHARSRGARALEALAPGPEELGFLLRRRLTVRGVLLALEAPLPAPAARLTLAPARLAAGPALVGWVADLDRETRGFARTPEWSRWSREGEVWSSKRSGRPEAVAALRLRPEAALLGPVEARSPEAAADALSFLIGRAAVLGARAARLVLPAEARALLARAFASGFSVSGSAFLAGSRPHGDFRRYAASCGPYL